MKYLPTCIIIKIPTCKHIIGKIWFDTETRVFVKGDKTPRQKKKELKKGADRLRAKQPNRRRGRGARRSSPLFVGRLLGTLCEQHFTLC